MVLEQHVSGYDFVRALLLAGYRVVGATLGHVVMDKDGREVVVPQCEVLSDESILYLLKKADVAPLYFITLLHRLGSRDTLPDPEESRTARSG